MEVPFDPGDLDRVLDAALELPPSERLAYVRREAAGRPGLLEATEQVLREAERDDDFLDPADPRAVALREAVLDAADADDDDLRALQPGDTFTTFEVVGFAGRGGMGEVYRARDARLGRHVALKVLPRAFVEDPQRLARFEREARVLASLNHPNIGAIYGLVEDGGRQALVLEFVDGEPLGARIQAGPMPVTAALGVARQIALALETAHRHGIVHRDLKPGNVVVAADGTVKVLDFGLAKAARRDGTDQDPSVTSMGPPGALLGTPAYMAPEQVHGTGVDHRADIWAFGCVLFEMLAGVRAFEGSTTSEVLARVLDEREPDFGRLPPSTPEPLRRMLRRAITRDPRRRLADMAEVRREIDAADHVVRKRGSWVRTALAAAAGATVLVLAGVAAGVIDWHPWSRPPAVRFAIPIPGSDQLLPSGQQVAAISPDGRTLVYRAIRSGRVHLFRRAVGDLASEPIPGTENAAGPFFSPDGGWLGFDGDGVLQKVPLDGGSPVTISGAPGGADASWGGDVIVFSTSTARGLQRVSAMGGEPEPLTSLDEAAGDLAHAFPFVLPRADAALFTIVRAGASHVAVVRFATGEVRLLAPGAQPRYAAGHVVFVRDQSLWAAPFNDRQLAMTGAPRRVVDGLDIAGGRTAHFAIAQTGTLIYTPRREVLPARAIVWVDGSGAETTAPLAPKPYTRAALSPNGRQVALAASESGNTDIWVGELATGAARRLTHEPTVETAPLWSPDGKMIVFRSDRDGGGLFMRRADGADGTRRLTVADTTLQTPHGFSPDGRTVLFTDFRSYTDQAIAAVDVAQPLQVRYLVERPGAQLRPQVSPDGRWLAYQSDESGQFEIVVGPYPGVEGARHQVSRGGGTSPRWSADGRHLYYYDGRGVTAVPIEEGPAFSAGAAQRLVAYAPFGGRLGPDYDPAPDGGRFLFIRPAIDTPSSRAQLLVVQNWFAELRTVSR